MPQIVSPTAFLPIDANETVTMATKALSLTALILGVFVVVESTNYCSLSPQHTLCKFKGPSQVCGNIFGKGVNKKDIEQILKVMNDYRNQMASGSYKYNGKSYPPAVNMMELKWDPELAAAAQGHAEQCVFGHDCNECRKVARFSVGQNVYIDMQTVDKQPQWPKPFNAWKDEVKFFDPKEISAFQFSPQVGHFTQQIWGTTSSVGCGFISFRKPQSQFIERLYVCNYGPAGNMMGYPIYQTRQGQSRSCAAKELGPSRAYPHLCQEIGLRAVPKQGGKGQKKGQTKGQKKVK